MARGQHHVRLGTGLANPSTITVMGSTCRLKRIVSECSNAGTTWTLKIQDRATPNPGILAAAKTQTADTGGAPTQIDFGNDGIIMENGIDVVSAGTSGVADIWFVYGSPPT